MTSETTESGGEGRPAPDDMLPLLREQASYGSLVLFLGAGVSHDAGLPTWAELVAPLHERLGLDVGVDPLDVADYFVESEVGGRPALEQEVRRILLAPRAEGTRAAPDAAGDGAGCAQGAGAGRGRRGGAGQPAAHRGAGAGAGGADGLGP